MKALKTTGSGDVVLSSDVPIPRVRSDHIVIRNKAVALNPADWKFLDLVPSKDATIGCDFAGIVEDVGDNLTTAFKKGDRVAGFAHGNNPKDLESGAFSEYVLAKSGCSLKIPDDMSFESACGLGVGITTVGQAMYEGLKLPWPGNPSTGTTLLVYGGSTATGTLAIQMAKL
jgi:NADPH:quinone reductase-like Zn-dependent oxidoreductase